MSDNPFDDNKDTETTVTPDGLSVTLKGGPGFDAPWIVIHTQTAEQAKNALRDVHTSELPKAVAIVAEAFGKVCAELNVGQQRQAAGGASGNKPSYSKGGSKSSGGSSGDGDIHPTEKCPDCGGPVSKRKSGTSKRGPWTLWKCTSDGGHDAVFTNG